MYFRTTFDNEFDDLMMYLKGKYPKELFDMEGIGKQTDMGEFGQKFFSEGETVSDLSVDANSNVDDLTVVAYENEMPKPYMRQNSLYLLWKYGKRFYGLAVANKIVEMELTGDIYINDMSNIQKPYCFNFSTYDLMVKGLPFVKKINSAPPKHLNSFIGQLIHFTSYASNQVMGAVGLADVLLVASYYVKKELDNNRFKTEELFWKDVKQEIQSLIYSCNQPFRGGLQSGFYNVSIYDKYFLEELSNDYLFPDGSTPDVEIVNKLQDIYIDLINETLSSSPITFPVTTACFCVDDDNDIKDLDFLQYISQKNQKYAFINIYAGKTSTLSSCCFSGNQKTLTKSSNGINYMTFEELYNSPWKDTRRNFTIFHNGSWCKGKTIRLPKRNLHSITTVNNKNILATDNHLHPTLRGDISTDKLTLDDYILFNTMPIETYPEKDMKLTYEQGIIIGAYLGDGSIYKRKNNNSVSVSYSLNSSKYEKLIPLIQKGLRDCDIETEIHLNTPYNNVYPVNIYSAEFASFVREWVYGETASEKELNLNCIIQSREFRKGIIDGLYYTDGGNSNRIYSTSQKMIEQIEVVMTSLGLTSIIDISDRTDEKCIIRGEEYKHNFPLYCIRWYDMKNKRSAKDIYVIKNNCLYFKIKSIEKYVSDEDFVYCFEMENTNEPYFTLPNGIITHNCRLRSDKTNEYLGYSNSFGAGNSKVGSFGVITLNLPRIAIRANGDVNKYYELLKEVIDYSIKINHIKRYILTKRKEIHALPLYDYGFMDMQKQYATIGLNGINEAITFLGYDILKKDGQQICSEILNVVNNMNDEADKMFGYAHNTEQTPSENSSIKLAQKDKLLGYQSTYELYSNQFIPLITNADMLDRIKLQGLFDSQFSGGAICHINIESTIEDTRQIAELIKTAVKMGVVYHSINYNLQKCENGHISVGRKTSCPICGGKITDNYTRAVGFLVNTKNLAPTRRKYDYPLRQFYTGI